MMTKDDVKRAFKEAMAEDIDQELASYKDITPTYSREFLGKMDLLIKRERNPLWHLVNTTFKKTIAMIALCLFVLFSLMSVPKVRAYAVDFFKRVFSSHIELEQPQKDTAFQMSEYCIRDLPVGYRESSHVETPGFQKTEYMDEHGSILILEQWSSSESIALTYDNEVGTVSEFVLNGVTIHCYHSEGYYSFSWENDDTALRLSSYGDLSEEDCKAIIESILQANVDD